MLKAEPQLYNGTKGKLLTYYGRRNLLLVCAGCGCSRFSARLLRQGNRVALRRLLGVKNWALSLALKLQLYVQHCACGRLVMGNIDS